MLALQNLKDIHLQDRHVSDDTHVVGIRRASVINVLETTEFILRDHHDQEQEKSWLWICIDTVLDILHSMCCRQTLLDEEIRNQEVYHF